MVERPGGGAANPVPGRTIGEHGAIGNLETVALVARDGTVDYLCWPRLDSPTVFAALLDPERGGGFSIVPRLEGAVATQLYVPDTNVLLTRFVSRDGAAEVTDFMPHPEAEAAPACTLIRMLRVTRGEVGFALRCGPRFDYGRAMTTAREAAGGVRFAGGDGPALMLTGSVALGVEGGDAVAAFTLAKGGEALFVLGDAEADAPGEDEVRAALGETVSVWRRWAAQSNYRGRWREAVTRSALALKLLTSERHGSIAAAATFGLPEATEGDRNWDYRATWIRDASFTVYAFMRLGYIREAERFRDWVSARAREAGSGAKLRIMYALDGSDAADEETLDHLAGYGGTRPVRIGNAAHGQSQLDIYGELMDSAYLSNKYGSAISHQGWAGISAMIEHVCAHWRDDDAGIWEFRDRERALLHSRLMCWVALDRATRLAFKRSLPAPTGRWTEERDRIGASIWEEFRHPEGGYFVQEKGGTELDAALLMMPLVRFVSATDPVWLATLDAIGETLVDDGLVFRYRGSDGLEGGEGAFTTCTFWYVECLARAGRLDEAQSMMAKGLAHANALGLFSEELDGTGGALGNFPQALTHLAFISAAYFLDRRLDRPSGGEWQP